MNISNISFCGTTNNNGRRATASSRTSAAHNGGYAENASIQRNNLRKSAGLDSFESNNNTNVQNNKKKKPMNPYKLGLLGLAVLKMLSMMHSCATEPDPTAIAFANAGEDVGMYAERYGSSEEAIMAYNKLSSDILNEDMELVIPALYEHPVDGEIEELQEDLYSNKLDAEERTQTEEEIAQLQALQQLQDETAVSYIDGDYIYFTIKNPDGVNVETFKGIFGIKDGVVKKHNDIDFTWGSNEYGGYMDFTGAYLREGETIRIPNGSVAMKYVDVE